MDRLSPLFARFVPSARVFYSGNLCQVSTFEAEAHMGHVHLMRRGTMSVIDRHGLASRIEEPSLLFFPQSSFHQLAPGGTDGVDLVCASVDLGDEARGALISGMPEVLVIPLKQSSSLSPALVLLFQEAFDKKCGRQAALDQLMGYLFILMLRYLLDSSSVNTGILAALGDPRLSKAVISMHERPDQAWTLESLAETAGMSRARFANHFREVSGLTALNYLTAWRITVAKSLLKRGKPLKSIAPLVGYASTEALTRAFTHRIGMPPLAWLQAQATLDLHSIHKTMQS
jgi:AraC-like DNA-binding protein